MNLVAVRRVSFGDFLRALKPQRLPKHLAIAVEELRHYLGRENLLPSWERQLIAVNWPDSLGVLSESAYLSHRTWDNRQCRFFGLFQGNYVRKIAMIRARVDIQDDKRATLIWQNEDPEGIELEAEARLEFNEHRAGRLWYPTRVLLLGPLFDTRFTNQVGSADFDAGLPGLSDAESLADELNGKVWISEDFWLPEEKWKQQSVPHQVPFRFGGKTKT